MPVPRGSLVDGNRRGATTPNRRAAGSHLQATRQRPAPWTAPLTWLSWSGCAAAAMPLSTDSRQNTWAHSSRRVSNLQRDTSRGEAGTGVHQLINQARRLRQQAQCRGMLLDQGPADMPAMQGPCFSAQRGEALRARRCGRLCPSARHGRRQPPLPRGPCGPAQQPLHMMH